MALQDDTDLSLAMLASIAPDMTFEGLLELLVSADGDIERAKRLLGKQGEKCSVQPSLKRYVDGEWKHKNANLDMNKDGVLHLYEPQQIAAISPCTLLLNIFQKPLARSLALELLDQSKSWTSNTFRLFDRTVTSPHRTCFYVLNNDEQTKHGDFTYNGSRLEDVRLFTPSMVEARSIVEKVVNREMEKRQRLPMQHKGIWEANVAFTNIYGSPSESVGMHADQLQYLGPHPTIASLSLGVVREFRIRKTTPGVKNADTFARPVSLHLPHNSLLIMHAEMQEQWKHAIHPARSVEPHEDLDLARINVTYRFYRDEFSPQKSPRCKCGVPMALRTVMKSKENYGRYFWQCDSGKASDTECGQFVWAKFTDEGVPIW